MSHSDAENPLLSIGFAVPFDPIPAEHVESAAGALLASSRGALDAIERTDGPRTYENTLGALEKATEPLDVAVTVVSHLESVATTPALRPPYNAGKPDVNAFYATTPLRPFLWKALKEFSETPEAASLSPAKKRFLERTVDDF